MLIGFYFSWFNTFFNIQFFGLNRIWNSTYFAWLRFFSIINFFNIFYWFFCCLCFNLFCVHWFFDSCTLCWCGFYCFFVALFNCLFNRINLFCFFSLGQFFCWLFVCNNFFNRNLIFIKFWVFCGLFCGCHYNSKIFIFILNCV